MQYASLAEPTNWSCQ